MTPTSSASRLAQTPNYPSPAITFPPDKSDLYNRRALRKPDPSTAFPSPPSSDSPSHEIPSSNHGGIFHSLFNHPELIFEMVHHLDINDLLALYSISRDFHALANIRFTTMMHSQSLSKAPESSRIFPFRCYRNLCLRDPAGRRNEAKPDFQIRHVPGFRWLRMVVFREGVVDGIVECLEKEGLMLPPAATLTIKKIWFFMDLPTNKLRSALVRNTKYWTEDDLYVASMFIMKLDMLFTCPMTGEGDLGLRKMLLGQRSLSTLLHVLRREKMRNSYEMLKMIVAWNYERTDEERELDETIFGVPPHKVGMLQYEGWGRNPNTRFHQIDMAVNMECVRRGLDLPAHYLDMVLYGFVDKATGLDIWTKDQRRKQEEVMEREARGKAGHGSAGDDDRDDEGLEEKDDFIGSLDKDEDDDHAGQPGEE